MNNRDFSVLMSVYLKENSQYLKDSIDSIFNNTIVPSELIIIEDGVLRVPAPGVGADL